LDDVEREPCTRCGEPAALGGSVCPHCGASLLVDLVLARAVSDEKLRYQAARAIAAIGSPLPGFLEAQKLLAAPHSRLCSGLTRAAARRMHDLLAVWGVEVEASFPRPRQTPLADRVRLAVERLWRAWGWRLALPAVVLAAVWLTVSSLRRPATTRRDLAARALASTAMLKCGDVLGSGFFISPDVVLTNQHVVASQSPVLVTLHDGTRHAGRVRRKDSWLDLALVDVPGVHVAALPLGDASGVRPGDSVLAIGNPLGLDFTVTQGIVSNVDRFEMGIAYLQFDANINPGNSGGPLVASDGRVVGVVTMMLEGAKGLALAVPINYLFAGSNPMTKAPPGANDQLWRAKLQKCRAAELRQMDRLQSAFALPGLAGMGEDDAGNIVAVMIRRTETEPGPESFQFSLQRGGAILCQPSGQVSRWQEIAANSDTLGETPRLVLWLRRRHVSQRLFVGSAPINWEVCPEGLDISGAELVLNGADPTSDRVTIK
jgi:serine protease Do